MSQYTHQQHQFHFSTGRITWAAQRLILANVIIFALQLIWDPIQAAFLPGAPLNGMAPGGLLNTWLGFQPDLFLYGYLWKPFSYQFLHGGLMHLFMNMLWLFFFGPDVERTLGTRQFFRFYIACGALGVLCTIPAYVIFGDTVSVTGASGAVMGIMVAFAIIDPERQFFLFPLPVPITARALVLIIVVMNLVVGISGGSPVSVATHFGGMGAGYLLMKSLPKYHAWKRQRQTAPKPDKESDLDRIGEAVDNIFKFKDRKRH